MTLILTADVLYKSELDELFNLLNKIDGMIKSHDTQHIADSNFVYSLKEFRDTCLFRIRLVEGMLAELALLKIN